MQRASVRIAFAVAAVALLLGPGGPAAAQGAAATGRGDAALSGVFPGPGPAGAPVELWRLEADGLVGPPVVAAGVAYVYASDAGLTGGRILALDARTGAERWRFEQDRFFMEVEAVAGEMVYVRGHVLTIPGANFVAALEAATGRERWRLAEEGVEVGHVTVADGTAYVTVEDRRLLHGALRALEAASGEERWRVDVGRGPRRPAVAAGVVYVTVDDGLRALDAADGAELWRYEPPLAVDLHSPAAVGAGLVVFSRLGVVVALNAVSGTESWTFDPEGFAGMPAVAGDGVYVTEGGGFGVAGSSAIRALDPATGREQWTFPTEGDTTPPAVADGAVYVGSEDGHLYALDATTGAERWRFAAGDMGGSTGMAVVDGVVYLDGDDALYAIGGSEGTPAA